MADEPRAYTDEEATKMFLEQVYQIKEYWEKEDVTEDNLKGRMEGCVFSIMALLDGSNVNFPAVSLIAMTHPTDEDFHKERGENWFEDGTPIGNGVELHDEWQRLLGKKEEDNVASD